MDEVFIHFADPHFSSRCAPQDCYVIPVIPADGKDPPRAVLRSPFMLSPGTHTHRDRHCLRRAVVLWRCGSCGREQSVAADMFPRKAFSPSKNKKGRRIADTARRTDARTCVGCYSCPRCSAPALVMSLTKQMLYIASCPYCAWRSEAHSETLQELLAALDARSPERVLASYHTTLQERMTCADMEPVSVSRLALEEYKSCASDERHPALVLEELRHSIRSRQEKVAMRCTSLRESELELSDRICKAGQAEPHAGVLYLDERAEVKSKEGHEKEEEDNVVTLPNNSKRLIHLSQMEQNGFSVHLGHSVYGNSKNDDTGILIRVNTRYPLMATVLTSGSESNERGVKSEIVAVNGIDCDPSFPIIQQDIPTRLGRRMLVTAQLSAALHLPVLLYAGHTQSTGGGAESRRFVWRNLGETGIVIRHLCVAREVSGTFDVSLTVSNEADEDAWIRIAPQETVPFTVTHHRSRSGPSGRYVMVGLLLEVLTQLPVSCESLFSDPQQERSAVQLLQRVLEEEEGRVPAAEETAAIASRVHIVEYGQTIVW